MLPSGLNRQMALNDKIQLGFIFAAVFFCSVHDKCRICLGPEADGFVNPAKGLSVDEFDAYLVPVFPNQFANPVAEKEISLPNIRWIFAEIFFVPLFSQTHLICHEFVMLSAAIRDRNHGKHLDGDRHHGDTPPGL